MPRNPRDKCSLSWEDLYGTTISGNLPRATPEDNIYTIDISLITYPGVKTSDFRYYHMKCPYSNEADIHYVRNNNPQSANYGNLEEVLPSQRSSHTSTGGIMIKRVGSRPRWVCVDDNCYYYTTLESGSRYFQV